MKVAQCQERFRLAWAAAQGKNNVPGQVFRGPSWEHGLLLDLPTEIQ